MAKQAKSPLDSLLDSGKIQTFKQIADLRKNLPVLATGIFPLDLATGEVDPELGNGGVRAGSIVEFCGKNNSFKSGTSDQFIYTTQQRYPGRSVAVLYSEVPEAGRLESVGIDIDNLVAVTCVDQTGHVMITAEEALETVLDLIAIPEIKLVVIDSLAALPVADQLDRDMSQSDAVAALAKVTNRFCLKVPSKNKSNAVIVIVNHYRDPITTGMSFGPPKTRRETPGGRGMEFLADLRVICSAKPIYDEKNHPIEGNKTQTALKVTYEIFKNKYCPTTGNRTVTADFNTRIHKVNNEEKALQYAQFFGKKDGDKLESIINPPVVQAGAWYYIGYPETKRLQGSDNAIKYLVDNPEIYGKLVKELTKTEVSEKFFEGNDMLKASTVLDQDD